MHRDSLRNTAARRYRFYNKPQLPVAPLETNPEVMVDQNQPVQQDNAAGVKQNQANAPVANPPVNNHPDGGVAPDGLLPGPPLVIAAADETLPAVVYCKQNTPLSRSSRCGRGLTVTWCCGAVNHPIGVQVTSY